MEKFNLNEGNEALNRVLLMMKYDAKKTLTENVEDLEEQVSPGTLATGTAGALAGGSIAAGGYGALAASAGIGAAAAEGAAIGTAAFPVVGTAIGALVGLGLGALINWGANKDSGKEGFQQLIQVCKSRGISKLVPKMSASEIRSLANTIEDAKGDWNDDEDAIVAALQKVETIPDLCKLDKKVTGGLVEFLDNLTDSPDEWKMFTRPIQGMIEDTQIILTPKEQKKVGGGGKKVAPVVTPGTSKYRRCVGTYTQGCISDAITQVQGCLSLVTDGKFGPKTQAALASKGFSNGFKDSDVPKICPSSTVPGQTPQDKLNQDYGVTPQPNAQGEVQTTNDDINNY